MVLTTADFTTENDIKDAIQKNPGILEEGLFILGREYATESGFLDLLGVDSEGQLVVIEAKNRLADSETLVQLLRYMDHVDRNKGAYLEAARHRKRTSKVSLTDSPRGIIVAPGFRDDLKKVLRFVKKGFIGLSEISCWEDKEISKRYVLCKRLQPEWEQDGVKPPPDADEVLGQVKPASVRETAKEILEWVRAMPEIEERTREKSIGFRHGQFFLYLVPQQRAIQLKTLVDDHWKTVRIKNSGEWTEDVRAMIKKSFSDVGGVLN